MINNAAPFPPSPVKRSDLLTEAAAAAILRVKPDTLHSWRTQKRLMGKGPAYIQHGQGRVLYHRADLGAWLAANRRTGAPPHAPGDSDEHILLPDSPAL